jgi:hypothetical protein
MFFLLGCVGWVLLIAGALPKPGQKWIEDKLPWWSARWASAASALIEATFGYFLLRSFLIEAGVEDALPSGGTARAVLGLFLAVEGVLRFVVTTQGAAAAALPLLAIWRLIAAIVPSRER